ncbi:hypothetical protein BS78_04G304400 [Paspalum vaginatum]|nr:hypothetical protein BS78_04G304400 [Paspalum vaginatum]
MPHLRVDCYGHFVIADQVLLEKMTVHGASRSYSCAATTIENICQNFGGHTDKEFQHYLSMMRIFDVHPYLLLVHPCMLPLSARSQAYMDAYDFVWFNLTSRQRYKLFVCLKHLNKHWANIMKDAVLNKWFAADKCKPFDPKKPENLLINLRNVECHSLDYQKMLGIKYTKKELRILILCKVPNVLTTIYLGLFKAGQLSKIESESYFCLPGMACCPPGFCMRKEFRLSLSQKAVSSNSGYSGRSFSAPVNKPFSPVSRSMTRASSNGLKRGSARTSTRRISSCASFSIQSAASSSKMYRDEENMSPGNHLDGTAMQSPTKNLLSCKGSSDEPSMEKPAIEILGGKGAALPLTGKSEIEIGTNFASLPAKVISAVPLLGQQLQPDAPKNTSIIILAITNEISQVNELAATEVTLPRQDFQTDYDKKPPNFASLPAKTISATTNAISQSADAAVPLFAQQLQSDTAKNSSFITQAVANELSQVNWLAATVVTLPAQNLQTDYDKKPPSVPIMTNQASGLAGANAPLVTPELEIRSVKDTSNRLSSHPYMRALLIMQQEHVLQQYKLGGSQPKQQQQQELYIKGPVLALFENDDVPLVEPLGMRCQLCKLHVAFHLQGDSSRDANAPPVLRPALFENDDAPPVEPLVARCQLCMLDVAFRPQGDAGRDANAPPVVAVLSCRHEFHSSCIESVNGLAEPAECLACLEPGQRTETSI